MGATAKDYNNTYKFAGTGAISFSDDGSTLYATTASQEVDWWDQQVLTTATGTTISWNTIADRPGTSSFAAARGSRNDDEVIKTANELGMSMVLTSVRHFYH